jgi:hypothetical protein
MQNFGFKCISNEADLICELLKHGAKATDGIIQQSSMIRMCTLSLMHLQLQGFHAIDAAAAMVVSARLHHATSAKTLLGLTSILILAGTYYTNGFN